MSSECGRARFLHHGDLYPFLKYAAFQWGHHAREADNDPHTCNIALKFLSSEHFSQLNELRHQNWPNYWLSSRQSPLHETCYFGLGALTIKLLYHKFNANELDSVHQTPLHYAALEGHSSIIQILLDCQDLDVNGQGRWGDTALHFASLRGHTAVVKTLLQQNAIQVNLQNQQGQTSLHQCAMEGHEAVVRQLLDHQDIHINALDNTGQTPLHLAIKYSNIQTSGRPLSVHFSAILIDMLINAILRAGQH
jgi:ankyrin repeat protein